jgi:hypothetical protein
MAQRGFIFEQGYPPQKDRTPINEMAQDLKNFFKMIPRETRCPLELQTDLYLGDQIRAALEKI